ncbi:hypothetical protein HDU80_002843 [Chytriomyces hyalinus]|nr:hypothetical protein HDU80_002843 [Chytriomyces hyalinus]
MTYDDSNHESLWQDVDPSSASSVETAIAEVEDLADSNSACEVVRTLIQEHADCIFHVAASRNKTNFFSVVGRHLGHKFVADALLTKNANAETPVDCARMFPALSASLAQLVIANSQVFGELATPQVLWRDLVGMDAPREELVQFRDPNSAGLTPIRIILHGPPGTGKSLLALSFAGACGCRVFPIQTAKALGTLLGDSQKNVSRMFEDAAKTTPKGIVILDEIDNVVPANKSGSSTSNTLGTLLDRIVRPGDSLYGVSFIATSNHLQNIDPATLNRCSKIAVKQPSRLETKALFQFMMERKRWNPVISDWPKLLNLSSAHLSILGIERVVATALKANIGNAQASLESAIRKELETIPLEPVHCQNNFIDVSVAALLSKMPLLSLRSCLAVMGWDFDSSPAHVYRQIVNVPDNSLADKDFLLSENKAKRRLLCGPGVRGVLQFAGTSDSPFKKYKVFMKCNKNDGSNALDPGATSVLIESYGSMGVRCLEWIPTAGQYLVLPPPSLPMKSVFFLAQKSYVAQDTSVYFEAFAGILKQTRPFVITNNTASESLAARDARKLIGSMDISALSANGISVFLRQDKDQMVSVHSRVLFVPKLELEWKQTAFAFDVISSPSQPIPIKPYLALCNQKWASETAFIEVKSDKSYDPASTNYLLLSSDLTQYLPKKSADSLLKSSSPSLLSQNGFRVFSLSSGSEQVSPGMRVLISKSCHPMSWKVSTFNKINPSLTSSKLSVTLASSMCKFECDTAFVAHFQDSYIPAAARVIVHRKDTDEIIDGNDAHSFINGYTTRDLSKFGFSVFVAAQSQDEIVPANRLVLCADNLTPVSTQLDSDSSRFLIVDPEASNDIGSLLLNKPIPFTTLKSILIQHTIGRHIRDGQRVVAMSLEAQTNVFEFYGDTKFADDLVSSGKYLVCVECTSERDSCSPLRKVIVDTKFYQPRLVPSLLWQGTHFERAVLRDPGTKVSWVTSEVRPNNAVQSPFPEYDSIGRGYEVSLVKVSHAEYSLFAKFVHSSHTVAFLGLDRVEHRKNTFHWLVVES